MTCNCLFTFFFFFLHINTCITLSCVSIQQIKLKFELNPEDTVDFDAFSWWQVLLERLIHNMQVESLPLVLSLNSLSRKTDLLPITQWKKPLKTR